MKTKKIELPELTEYSENIYLLMNPDEYKELIFSNALKITNYIAKTKKQNCDLYGALVKWGSFSNKMNKILRMHINKAFIGKENYPALKSKEKKQFDLEIFQYKIVYALWWNRTHYFDTYRKSFFGQISTRKNILEGLNNLLNLYHLKVLPNQLNKRWSSFIKLIDRLSTKDFEKENDWNEVMRKDNE